MGYTTDFSGQFILDKPLDDETFKLLNGLANTRRMKRKVDPKYGIDGEFYIEGNGFMGQDREENIVDFNQPPRTQPSLWCQWIPNEDDKYIIEWNGGEKFYNYIEWIKYIIEKILKPKGYTLNGDVCWSGESAEDIGLIRIMNNTVVSFELEESIEIINKILDNKEVLPILMGINKNLDKMIERKMKN